VLAKFQETAALTLCDAQVKDRDDVFEARSVNLSLSRQLADRKTSTMTISVQNDNLTLAAVQIINSSTIEWGLEPLPSSNITFINGTLTNGTVINNRVYNGIHINGTTIIEREEPTMIGSVPLISFIYIIMSILVIGGMAFKSVKWAQAALGAPPKHAPNLRLGLLPEREFEKSLEKHYPPDPPVSPTPAYAETIKRDPNQGINSQDLRECRELIRAKFALDVDVYNLRDVDTRHMALVQDKMRRSEGAMIDIQKLVRGWREAKDQWTAEEWEKVEEIDYRVNGPHRENIPQ
jgi:hypothetical protein